MSTAKSAAKAAPKKEVEVNRNIPTDIAGKTYVLGEKPYNPRVLHNSVQWERMVELLDKAGANGVSGKVLAESLAQHVARVDETHFNFISYLTRRHSLAVK